MNKCRGHDSGIQIRCSVLMAERIKGCTCNAETSLKMHFIMIHNIHLITFCAAICPLCYYMHRKKVLIRHKLFLGELYIIAFES